MLHLITRRISFIFHGDSSREYPLLDRVPSSKDVERGSSSQKSTEGQIFTRSKNRNRQTQDLQIVICLYLLKSVKNNVIRYTDNVTFLLNPLERH